MFITYLTVLFYENKQGKYTDNADFEEPELGPQSSYPKLAGIFVISVTLLIFASKLIVTSATSIAAKIGIPPAVISLTVVAFGTSIPEVATCVTAAKKKFGSVAIGNIIGANIMNICWVAGASAMINPLQIQKADTYFMFPWMLGMTILVLALIAYQMRLTKFKGYILLIMYVLYIISFIAYYDPFNKEEQGITQPTKEEVSLNHAAYNHFNGC
jgi:cation:H+ antiporter